MKICAFMSGWSLEEVTSSMGSSAREWQQLKQSEKKNKLLDLLWFTNSQAPNDDENEKRRKKKIICILNLHRWCNATENASTGIIVLERAHTHMQKFNCRRDLLRLPKNKCNSRASHGMWTATKYVLAAECADGRRHANKHTHHLVSIQRAHTTIATEQCLVLARPAMSTIARRCESTQTQYTIRSSQCTVARSK